MKTILCTLALGLSLVVPSFGQATTSDFVGIWKVKDGREKTFFITLTADGKAQSFWESPQDRRRNAFGTWKQNGDAAQITWGNGWRETIRKDGSGYSKQAYSREQTDADQPINTSTAEKVDAIPGAE
jgi:hypothetical protein